MNKTKIFAAIVSAAICLSLFTGCSSESSAPAVSFTSTASVTSGKPAAESSAEAVSEKAESSTKTSNLALGEAQAYLNGEIPDGVSPIYTKDSFGHNFYFYVADGNYLFLFFGVIPDGKCTGGTSYTYNMLDESTVLGMFIYDFSDNSEPLYYYYNTSENPDVITGGSIDIGSFSSESSAEYSIKTSFIFNGKSYSFEGSAYAPYTDPENFTQSSTEDDGTCLYCGGSGICSVCHGLGYTTWGGTTIDCTACDNGVCYYCEGTGIQVYSVRGVRKN